MARSMGVVVAVAVALAGLAPRAWADEVRLINGDHLTGEVTKVTDDAVTLKTTAAGEVTIKRAEVLQVEPAEALMAKLVETPPEPEQQPDPLSGEIGAGYGLTTGNTQTSQLDGRVAANWKRDPHEVEMKADALYGSQDEKMNTQKYSQKGKYSHLFGKDSRWSWYAQEEADHDRFADIQGRITPSTGLGYWWTRSERLKFQTEAGLGVTYTNYRTKDSTTDVVLIPRLYGETMVAKVKLSEDWTFYPALSDLGEYRWKSETVAEYPLSQTLAARLSAVNERNSEAPVGKKKSDWRLLSTIVQKF